MMAGALPARCDDNNDSTADRAAHIASNSLLPFVALGETSLLLSGKDGNERALRGAGALLAAGAAETLLKRIVRERRPDSDGKDNSYSFPSGHATASFTMAAVVSRYQPRRRNLFYAGATLISLSRVQLHRHYLHDVVAGAAIGYFIGRRFTRDPSVQNEDGPQNSLSLHRSGEPVFSSEAFATTWPSHFSGGLSEALASSGAALSLGGHRQVLLSPRGVGVQMQW